VVSGNGNIEKPFHLPTPVVFSKKKNSFSELLEHGYGAGRVLQQTGNPCASRALKWDFSYRS
tara:strand:- start:336 stop:521 length:186 start_codon:yes stop_codon:yes gene_type:complete